MGYNLAKKKMKKKILTSALAAIMVAGMMIPLVSNASLKQTKEQSPMELSVNANRCIFGNFVAREEWETVATLTLQPNCEFYFINHETNEEIGGEYTMSNDIKRGGTSDLTFFVKGKSIGRATLAWPTEEPMCVFMNGMKFEKY